MTRSLVSEGNRCQFDGRAATLCCSAAGGVCSHLLTDGGARRRGSKRNPGVLPQLSAKFLPPLPPHFVRRVVDTDMEPRRPIRSLLQASDRAWVAVCVCGVFDALISRHCCAFKSADGFVC